MISFKEALKIHSSIPLKPLEIEIISLFESVGHILAQRILFAFTPCLNSIKALWMAMGLKCKI